MLNQSQHNEWDRQNVIMTGGSDGVVRMWSLDYVEVAVDSLDDNEVITVDTLDNITVSSITQLAKKMSVSMTGGDCVASIREAVSRGQEVDLSTDTEDGDITDNDNVDIVDGCSPLPDDQCEVTNAVKDDVIGATADNSFVVIHSPEHGPGPSLKPGQ